MTTHKNRQSTESLHYAHWLIEAVIVESDGFATFETVITHNDYKKNGETVNLRNELERSPKVTILRMDCPKVVNVRKKTSFCKVTSYFAERFYVRSAHWLQKNCQCA